MNCPFIPVLTGQTTTDFIFRAEKNACCPVPELTKKEREMLKMFREKSKNFKF